MAQPRREFIFTFYCSKNVLRSHVGGEQKTIPDQVQMNGKYLQLRLGDWSRSASDSKSALPDAATVLAGDLREAGVQDLPWSPKWNPEQQLFLTIMSWNALVMGAPSLVKAPTPITQRTWAFIMLSPQPLAAPSPERLTRYKSFIFGGKWWFYICLYKIN